MPTCRLASFRLMSKASRRRRARQAVRGNGPPTAPGRRSSPPCSPRPTPKATSTGSLGSTLSTSGSEQRIRTGPGGGRAKSARRAGGPDGRVRRMTPQYQIRADYDARTIVVYQAYSLAIADVALRAGRFVAPFSFHRMTWIKPSFIRSSFVDTPGFSRGRKRSLRGSGAGRADSRRGGSAYTESAGEAAHAVRELSTVSPPG